MRNKFGTWIHKQVQERQDIYLLSGDIGFGIFDDLIRDHPDHFINCGIAEQNMIGVSAGLSGQGLTPFVYTIIPFLLYRPYEFIRNLISHQNLKVILVGVGGGFSYDNLGFTHYAKEDLLIASTLPNFNIYTPYDVQSAEYCFEAALKSSSPSYIRLMKGGEENLPRLSSQKGVETIRDYGSDFTVLCHGGICLQAMQAVDKLMQESLFGKLLAVWNYTNLSSFLVDVSEPIFFVEEQIAPGLLQSGLMQSDFVQAIKTQPKIYFLGIKKDLDNKLNTRLKILEQHSLDSDSLVSRIKSILNERDL